MRQRVRTASTLSMTRIPPSIITLWTWCADLRICRACPMSTRPERHACIRPHYPQACIRTMWFNLCVLDLRRVLVQAVGTWHHFCIHLISHTKQPYNSTTWCNILIFLYIIIYCGEYTYTTIWVREVCSPLGPTLHGTSCTPCAARRAWSRACSTAPVYLPSVHSDISTKLPYTENI